MKKLIILGALCASISVSSAQNPPITAPVGEQKKPDLLASKTVFAQGFGEAQGIALQIVLRNEVPVTLLLVADYKRGEIVRLSRDGRTREIMAKGLKSPAQIVAVGETVYVTERKANRVVKIDAKGNVTQLGENIEEPLGLFGDSESDLRTVSHTTSKIFSAVAPHSQPDVSRISVAAPPFSWRVTHEAPAIEGAKYGYRNLVQDGQTLFLTDEDAGAVLMISPQGFVSKFADGIEDPAGITLHNGVLYVTDESNDGRLWQIDRSGTKKIVADGLGRPRGIVFIEPTTALVSDRTGKIWRVELS